MFAIANMVRSQVKSTTIIDYRFRNANHFRNNAMVEDDDDVDAPSSSLFPANG